MQRPYKARLTSALLAALTCLFGAGGGLTPAPPAFAGGCPGASGACPYVSSTSFGDAPGLLRSAEAVAVDAAGNIYVGDRYSYRIAKYDPSGNLIAQFGSYGGGDGQFSGRITGLVIAAGHLYATDSRGGRIEEFGLDGSFIAAAGGYMNSPNDSNPGFFNFPGGLATDGSFLYVADSENNRVQRMALDLTSPVVMIHGSAGGSADGQLKYPSAIAVTAANIYVADAGNNRVQRFDRPAVPFAAYQAKWGHGGGDGTYGNGNGEFDVPGAIATNSFGDVFVTDTFNQRVQEFLPAGLGNAYDRQWGSVGVANGHFNYPVGVTIDAADNVYVADGANDRVQKFDTMGGFLAKLGASGDAPGRFDLPVGVAVAPDGTIYEAQSRGALPAVVQRLTSAGAPAGSVFGPVTSWNFSEPDGLATDAAGDLFVPDAEDQRVDKFDPAGNLLSEFGGPSGLGDGQFSTDTGIAVDAHGNSYVVDAGNHRVEVFDSSGNFVRRWGHNGGDGTSGSTNGDFNDPSGIALDGAGNVLVTELVNERVQEFTTAGVFVRKWGAFGSAPGQFASPEGVAVAGGRVFVVDQSNDRVQEFTPTGAFVAQFGSPGAGVGRFENPLAIAADRAGNIYVADSGQNTIQKFVFSAPQPAAPQTPAPALPASPGQPQSHPQPPHLSLRGAGALTLSRLLSRGVAVQATSDQPGTLSFTLSLPPAGAQNAHNRRGKPRRSAPAIQLATGHAVLTSPGMARLRMHLTAAGRRALKHAGKHTLKLALIVTEVDSAGLTATATALITVRGA